MFDILFGWRKASKCKKLIRRVQCRLKLLKNKRCSIARQLRDDVAQLLKHGHEQSAFDRVEQLFKDESIVAVYDLLDHFCEFIIIQLSYIRKHKDCPNDINEAISTLIFASARCGDLPELPVIRKLFGERYGHRFAMVALELLPGNLVNRQIKENLSIKSVPNDVKYRLVDEIAKSCLQRGPLALEYYSELQQGQTNNNAGDQVLRSDVQTNCNRNEELQVQAFNLTETEGKIVHVDCSSDSKNLVIEPCHPQQVCDSTGTSTHSSTVLQASPSSVEWSTHRKEAGRVANYSPLNSPYKFRVDHKVAMPAESSSESSSQLPKEMIYLDDIEEFKSPMNINENCQDQRLFMFKSSAILTTDKPEDGFNERYIEKNESWNEKAGTRSSRKSRKASGKRHRRRSVSQESRGTVKDVESTIYYEESCDNSRNGNCKSHHRRKHQKKISFDESQKSYCAQARLDQPYGGNTRNNMRSRECSLEHPCYFCISNDTDDLESQKRRMTTSEVFPEHNLKKEKVENSIRHCRCFCTKDTHNQEVDWELLLQKTRRYRGISSVRKQEVDWDLLPDDPVKKLGKAEGLVHPQSCASSLCSCSRVTSPRTRKEPQPPYLRTMTMPPERPSDCRADNFLRSNSFPFQQPNHLSNGSSTCGHVHPKLPDYDQLAAKFTAIKKANLRYKSNQLVK